MTHRLWPERRHSRRVCAPPGRRLATFLVAGLLFLCARTAWAGVETWEPGGLRLVNSNDWLQALDPKDCRVLWSRPLRAAGEASLAEGNDHVWMVIGPSFLEGFAPATGQRLWRETGLDLAWGPERLGPALLTGERSTEGGRSVVTLVGRDLLTGRSLWREPLALDLASARLWGEDLLVRLKPGPAAAPTSRYRRAPAAEPEVRPAAERLALLNGARGSLRWAAALGAGPNAGPWIVDELALVEVRESGVHRLVAWRRQSEVPAWSLALPGTLVAEPARIGAGLHLVVDSGSGRRMLQVGLADGSLEWNLPVPGAPAAEPVVEGDRLHLVFTEPDPQAPAARPRRRTRLLTVDRTAGSLLAPPVLLPGTPAQVLVAPQGLWLLQKETFTEPDLDPRGREILDLRQGQPVRRPVEGHRVFLWQTGRAIQVAGHPRDALVDHPVLEAPAERVGGLLLYATRRLPERLPGQSRPQDFRHPEEPLILHALDPVTRRERWTFTDRQMVPGWTLEGGVLYLNVADRDPWSGQPTSVLVALDLETGAERWRGSVLKGLAGSPQVLPTGLFVLTDRDVAGLMDPASGALRASRDLVPILNWVKWNNLAGVLLLSGCIGWFLFRALRRTLFIRPIAGLAALDEAVGRATEMGKPVLYVPGLADVDDIQTLASLSILGHVARRTAEYDTPILVPNSRSVVMSMAQEVVQEAYTLAGRPESFQRDNVRYLSDEQFGFAAGVSGMMLRERPAANFLMGTFFAEALILAETGNATGAIQIAGSASASQLPFFVAACDYTLIGEELYAASAWLSRDPMQVGSLKGQDAAKAAIMAAILAGAVLLTLGLTWIKELMLTS